MTDESTVETMVGAAQANLGPVNQRHDKRDQAKISPEGSRCFRLVQHGRQGVTAGD